MFFEILIHNRLVPKNSYLILNFEKVLRDSSEKRIARR
jgi:hypothetical protein